MGGMSTAAPEVTQLMALEQQRFANARAFSVAPTASDRRQRQLYVGNLPTGMVTEVTLRELFTTLLTACDGFDGVIGPPVLSVQMHAEASYAFVEFRDEQLRETAMLFNGMELSGKPLKIYAANGYVQPLLPVEALKPPEELLKKLNAQGYGGETPEARKLYVGNLASGVNSAMLKELFTVPLQTVPGTESSTVPPVVCISFDTFETCAFVEFRNAALTTLALSLFNGTELCGRPLRVGRPTGYVAPTPDPSAPSPSVPALLMSTPGTLTVPSHPALPLTFSALAPAASPATVQPPALLPRTSSLPLSEPAWSPARPLTSLPLTFSALEKRAPAAAPPPPLPPTMSSSCNISSFVTSSQPSAGHAAVSIATYFEPEEGLGATSSTAANTAPTSTEIAEVADIISGPAATLANTPNMSTTNGATLPCTAFPSATHPSATLPSAHPSPASAVPFVPGSLGQPVTGAAPAAGPLGSALCPAIPTSGFTTALGNTISPQTIAQMRPAHLMQMFGGVVPQHALGQLRPTPLHPMLGMPTMLPNLLGQPRLPSLMPMPGGMMPCMSLPGSMPLLGAMPCLPTAAPLNPALFGAGMGQLGIPLAANAAQLAFAPSGADQEQPAATPSHGENPNTSTGM